MDSQDDIILEDLLIRLEDKKQVYEATRQQLRVATDPGTVFKLEKSLETLGEAIDQLENKIKERKAYNFKARAQAAHAELTRLLDVYTATQFDRILEAFRYTLTRWRPDVRREVTDAESLVHELAQIPLGGVDYSARSEFVAHLIHITSDVGLKDALIMWGERYRSGISLEDLHNRIEKEQKENQLNTQPAILLSFDIDEEASTQSGEDVHLLYRIRAWLIEDVETYKSCGEGCDSLVKIGSSENAPQAIEDLLANVTTLLNRFLEENTRRYPSCECFPEVHVFLPRELMHLAVDRWLLDDVGEAQPECLGHEQPVMLRCHDRYRASYRKRPKWVKYWRRSQAIGHQKANKVFVTGHDADLYTLFELLEDNVVPSDSDIVGLQLRHSPVNFEGMCQKVLDSGVPLAIWPRMNLAEEAHCEQLSDLLAKDCLSALPMTVQCERSKSRLIRRNPVDRHIGHHLSLWWDDPDLVPPKSA